MNRFLCLMTLIVATASEYICFSFDISRRLTGTLMVVQYERHVVCRGSLAYVAQNCLEPTKREKKAHKKSIISIRCCYIILHHEIKTGSVAIRNLTSW